MITKCLVVFASLAASVESFSSSQASARTANTRLYGYVPDGFTPETYKKFKAQEKAKQAQQKNLGGLGPRGFKSRSMQSFQEAMERGEASHLMPMFNAKEKLKSGKIRKEDIPYMQRGGNWDNSDVKGAKNKKKWLASDKQYDAGGFRKEQSVSIFGYGEGLDWTGKSARKGPEGVMAAAPKFAKNYKAPNVYAMKGIKKPAETKQDKPKKKGFFGF